MATATLDTESDFSSTQTPAPPVLDLNDPSVLHFQELHEELGFFSAAEFEYYARHLPAADPLIEGMLPRRSVNILVGDSGIGKSPFVCQLAMAVAAGVPFLGHATRRSKVVIMDYENAPWDARRMLEASRKHLRLARYPSPNFIIWPVQKEHPRDAMQKAFSELAPDLVIVDSLRSFAPEMEKDNTSAALEIKLLREIANKRNTAFLLVHHVRKQSVRRVPLGEGPALDWLLRTAGARALINQTDVRLAVAARGESDDTLVMHGHFRTRGEVGPLIMQRVWDDQGEPRGYDLVDSAPALLENSEQEAAFGRLPQAFSFKEALQVYDKQNNATTKFLRKLARLGLVEKLGPGQYHKREIAKNREPGQ